MDQVRQQVDADHPGVEFPDAELWAALDKMQDDNQIMVSENVVFLIWSALQTVLNVVFTVIADFAVVIAGHIPVFCVVDKP